MQEMQLFSTIMPSVWSYGPSEAFYVYCGVGVLLAQVMLAIGDKVVAWCKRPFRLVVQVLTFSLFLALGYSYVVPGIVCCVTWIQALVIGIIS